jgi:hypothetical protein
MKLLREYALDDLKQVYQFLHSQLPTNPHLMDSELLDDLQTYLQQQARQEGVDVSLHAQWATWLNA